jgi:ABC-type transport system substrate-binding protein
MRSSVALLVALGAMLSVVTLGAARTSNDADAKNLKIAIQLGPTILDPAQNYGRAQLGVLQLASGTLTTLSRDGKRLSMTLASSVKPAGSKRFVVTLKPNLKFSDGSPLNANDVAASFRYYLSSPTAGFGFMFTAIKQVTASGDRTVTFDLKRPYPSLPYILSYPTAAIMPAQGIKARGPKKLFNFPLLPTAGQFQVSAFKPTSITLKANPNYVGKKASAQTVTFQTITDPFARIAQAQSGQVDYADELPPSAITQISAPASPRTTTSVNGIYFLALNNRKNSVLSDVRIRKAVALAINRSQMNQVVWKGKNQFALGMFAKASRYYHGFLPTTPNITRAKALLAGTKCASGCTLQSIAHVDEVFRQIALITQQNLKAIGITVKITEADLGTVDERSLAGDFDFRPIFNFDNGDILDGYLYWLIGPAIEASYTGYQSPKMNRLINKASSSVGPARSSAVAQMNALFEKDVPFAPIAGVVVLSSSRVPSALFDLDPNLFYHVG